MRIAPVVEVKAKFSAYLEESRHVPIEHRTFEDLELVTLWNCSFMKITDIETIILRLPEVLPNGDGLQNEWSLRGQRQNVNTA